LEQEWEQPSSSLQDTFSHKDSSPGASGRNTSNTVDPVAGSVGYIPEAAAG